MKTILFLAFIVLVALAKKHNGAKEVRPADEVVPQWSCKKFTYENQDARDIGANSDKCTYLEYLKEKFKLQFTVPAYPTCYAELDGRCVDKIVDYNEKVNIRKFVIELTPVCQDGGAWEDVLELFTSFQERYGESYRSEYWGCIEEKIRKKVEEEYVPFPAFPAPFIDVMNYVCQGIISTLKNADRIVMQQWFDDNENFASLPSMGKPLWDWLNEQVEGIEDIPLELKQCFITEIGYFRQATIPEVDGSLNMLDNDGQDYDQAYLEFRDGAKDNISIPYEDWGGDEVGYECWNYYSPKTHFSQSVNNVNEDQFDGNRGHPLCPPNTMYQPLTAYGPMCCPITESNRRPYTYDCCQTSIYSPQVDRYGRTMSRRKPCQPCTCLEGYTMDVNANYFDEQGTYGACVKYEKKEE